MRITPVAQGFSPAIAARKGCATSCLVIALGASFAAQTPTPLRLTVEEAVTRGLDTSHRIGEAKARQETAEAIADERHATAMPVVAAQGGYMRTNHVTPFSVIMPGPPPTRQEIYPDEPNNYRTRLDVQWLLYTGGRLDALERAARIEATASSDEIALARADLTLEITRSYWSLVTSTEALRVVQEAVERINAHLRDVRNQLAAGLIPPNDVLTVEAQQSRQRMLAIQARVARDVAEAEVARLVGVTPGTPIEIATPIALAPAAAGSLDTLVDTARRQRPERAALEKRVAAARERGTAALAGRKPTIGVGGGVDYARPNPRIFPREGAWKSSWDAGINVNWPIFDGGKARSEVAEADAAARALVERLADVDASLALEVRQRLAEMESSRAAVDAAGDAVRSATEARRVLGERFAAGVATSTDVLDAQVALLQAELDRTQTIANAHLADARLSRALGR
jgi:outer membrane protein